MENVKSYYDPLIPPQVSGRHYFWANFKIPKMHFEKQIGRMNGSSQRVNRTNNHKNIGIDITKYKHKDATKLLNNCVAPNIGRAILESVKGIYDANQVNQIGLFEKSKP